jgi:error-prone DNA polymerase
VNWTGTLRASWRWPADRRWQAHRHGVGGLLDRLVGIVRAPERLRRAAAALLRDEEADNDRAGDLAEAFHVPVMATGGVRFATPEERPLFDVLTCIATRRSAHRAGRGLLATPSVT